MKSERVFCFKKDSLPYDFGNKHFSLRRTRSEFCKDMENVEMTWLDRNMAEKTLEYKQLIPYVLVEDGQTRNLFVYSRRGSEKRLHGYLSAGVGGHINPEDEDTNIYNTVLSCARREIHEELGIKDIDNLEILGLINEEYSIVGKVHLGIACILRIENSLQIRAGKEVSDYSFVNNIEEIIDDFELWTKLALELL